MGSLLKSIRTEKEIPIKNIALDLGISESTISQFETGKNMLSSERMKAYFFQFQIGILSIH